MDEELGVAHHLLGLVLDQAAHEAAVAVALLHHAQAHPAARARRAHQVHDRMDVCRHLTLIGGKPANQARGGGQHA
eukprot:3902787-Prymnesium_polylepis.1